MFNFLKRKTRNRRLNSGTVLEVKLRSDQVRSTRVRALALGFGVLFCTFFAIFMLWCLGNWSLRKLVLENTAFAIAEINVQTDGMISPEYIRRISGVKLGKNLMDLKLEDVKRNVELEAHIKSVSVERVLPRTLKIRATEREPIAQVNLALQSQSGGGIEVMVKQIDVEGFVMPPLDPRVRSVPLTQAEDPLPLITGINPADLLSTRHRVESRQSLAALQLIQKFEESYMSTVVALKKVDVSSPEVLTATTSRGSEITFAMQDIDQQLLRWREIYDKGIHYNRDIATLDLAVTNNIPARWMEASLEPIQPTRRAPKAPRNSSTTRRRNV